MNATGHLGLDYPGYTSDQRERYVEGNCRLMSRDFFFLRLTARKNADLVKPPDAHLCLVELRSPCFAHLLRFPLHDYCTLERTPDTDEEGEGSQLSAERDVIVHCRGMIERRCKQASCMPHVGSSTDPS
jgi:hypothetical protein